MKAQSNAAVHHVAEAEKSALARAQEQETRMSRIEGMLMKLTASKDNPSTPESESSQYSSAQISKGKAPARAGSIANIQQTEYPETEVK